MSAQKKDAPDIRVTCPECDVELLADPEDAGRTAVCPDCGKELTVPEVSAPAPKPVEPPVSLPAPTTKSGKFTLKDEPPAPPEQKRSEAAAVQPPWIPQGGSSPATHPPESHATAQLAHESRAKLAGWMRRVSLVVLALAIVKAFEAAWATVRMSPPSDLHTIIERATNFFRALPGKIDLLATPRTFEPLGTFTTLERFGIVLVIMLFLARLVVRSKLMDAIYVTTTRWAERSHGGLTWHALVIFLQAGFLTWAASMAKTPTSSDGMAGGLIAASLFISAIWLFSLHLISTDEFPGLGPWALADAVCGAAIVLILLWPQLAVLWTRAGAVIVLCMINGLVASHVGASFIFARRPKGWWWRKPLFLIVSCAIVIAVAFLLAVVR